MKQSLLKEAQNTIRAKKNKKENIAHENLQKAMCFGEFKKAYEKHANDTIEFAKNFANDQIENLENLEKSKENLEKIAKNLNILPIFAKFDCEKCEDDGIVDGKYCDCLKKEVTKILLEKSNFGKLEDFKNSKFEIFEDKEKMKKIYEVMQMWCNKNDSEKNLIYFLGEVGTGKTHLMRCMANELIKQNKIVLLTTAFSLSQEFLKFHTQREKGDQLQNLLDCEILFIDDLGTEPFYNNITREYTYLLINERRVRNLKTIITSNLQLLDLKEKYDERIFSRIIDKKHSIVLEIKGKDKRFV